MSIFSHIELNYPKFQNQNAYAEKVYIAYMGGMVGVQRVDGNYQPVANSLQAQMGATPAFQHSELPEYVIHEYDPLLDSPNMTPADWTRIGDLR